MLRVLSMSCLLITFLLIPSVAIEAAEPAEEEGQQLIGKIGSELERQALEVGQKQISEAPVEVGTGCRTCGPALNTTTSDVGQGNNCLRARTNLIQQLQQQIGCIHGSCYEQLVIEVPCDPQPDGTFHLTGYLKFKCWLEI